MEIRRLLVTKDVVYSEAGRNAPRHSFRYQFCLI